MKITEYKTLLSGSDRKPRLVKEKTVEYGGVKNLSEPKFIVKLLIELYQLDKAAEEYVYLVCLDGALKNVLGLFEVSHGSVNSSTVAPREIYLRALLCGAVSIILAHNHPSKDCSPSKEDKVVTRRIENAGELLNITLLDHIIIGGKGYYSFMEHGEMKCQEDRNV